MSKSDYLENKLLNHTLRNTAFTQPSALYIALFTADPTDAGTLTNEATGGSYARQSATFGTATTGSAATTNAQTYANMPAGTFTHFALMDALTAGNMLYSAALTTPRTTVLGDTLTFAIGAITASED